MKLKIYKQNYQIIVEYDGSKFVGWQMQKNGRSIQAAIQKVIKQVFGMRFKENIIGSGRTDAGCRFRSIAIFHLWWNKSK